MTQGNCPRRLLHPAKEANAQEGNDNRDNRRLDERPGGLRIVETTRDLDISGAHRERIGSGNDEERREHGQFLTLIHG